MSDMHLSTDLLVDFLHGELPPEDDALAYAHLQLCAQCRQEYDLQVALGDALRTAAAAEECEMPSLVKALVWERIRNAEPSRLQRLANWLRPAVAVPVAACLVVGGYFVSPLAHPSATAPTVDAAYYFAAHAQSTATAPLSEHPAAPALETSMAGTSGAPPAEELEAYAATGELDAVR